MADAKSYYILNMSGEVEHIGEFVNLSDAQDHLDSVKVIPIFIFNRDELAQLYRTVKSFFDTSVYDDPMSFTTAPSARAVSKTTAAKLSLADIDDIYVKRSMEAHRVQLQVADELARQTFRDGRIMMRNSDYGVTIKGITPNEIYLDDLKSPHSTSETIPASDSTITKSQLDRAVEILKRGPNIKKDDE